MSNEAEQAPAQSLSDAEDEFFRDCDEMAAALVDDPVLPLDEALLTEAFQCATSSGGGEEDQGALMVMKRNITKTCEDFARTFLGHGSSVSELHKNLIQCDDTLRNIQLALRRYLRRTEGISREIGVLQSKASETSVVLRNTLTVQSAVDGAVEALLVPPDTARVVLTASELELGPQFIHEVNRLGTILAKRRRSCISVPAPPEYPDPSSTVPMDMRLMQAHQQSANICRRLTGVACVKIRTFLIHKIDATLGKTRTNVAVQQQNVLREFRSLVYFLRQGSSAFDDPVHNPASALYEEVRHHYCHLVSGIYTSNIQSYLIQCNSLEIDWRKAAAPAEGTAAQRSGAFGSGFFTSTKHTAVHQPVITEKSAGVSGEDFALGARGKILEHINGAPVIPVVARRAKSLHSYEETFRSLMVLLCDVVTSEFLFSFDFFGGDTTVYVDVFKPTVQLIIDYVAEVVLRNSSSRSSSSGHSERRAVFEKLHSAEVNTDYCGLLIMIRLVHLFRCKMHTRRVFCLDGFFDSLLMLLWPAFKVAFDRQQVALRNCNQQTAVQMLTLYRSDLERLVAVHPITDRYAHLSMALMLLSQGISAREVEHVPLPTGLDGMESGATDSAESAHRFAVLEGNLGHLRIEYERVANMISDSLVAAVAKVPGIALTLAQHAFFVNNMFHVLAVWSGHEGVNDDESETASPTRDSVDGRTADSDDGSSQSSPTAASLLPGGASLSLARRLVHGSSDFRSLNTKYQEAATALGHEALRGSFSYFLDFVSDGLVFLGTTDAPSESDEWAAKVAKVGKSFAASLRTDLETVVASIRRFVTDSDNAIDVIKIAFTELLVANTRFHSIAAACVPGGANTLRGSVVTSQQLLQAMKRASGT